MTPSRADVLRLSGLAPPPNSRDSQDLTFQIVAWHGQDLFPPPKKQSKSKEDSDEDSEDDGDESSVREYAIKLFGVEPGTGRALSLTVTGFCPFFYLKHSDPRRHQAMCEEIRRTFGSSSGSKSDLKDVRIVRDKKDYWGFSDGAAADFVQVTTRTQCGLRKIAKHFSSPDVRAYESNVDPLLRFVHVADIRPAGFVRIPAGRFRKGPGRRSLAARASESDYHCDWTAVHPHDDSSGGPSFAPVLVAAFDIECSSSHSDFPVARKNYMKMATDIATAFAARRIEKASEYEMKTFLEACMIAPFRDVISEIPITDARRAKVATACALDMHVVYPKPISKLNKEGLTKKILELAGKHVDEVHRILKTASGDPVPALLGLFDKIYGREFPLEGDKVIQIGTTFHVFGTKETCFRHVITLGSCEEVPGATVVACETEKEVLMQWSSLISSTDPDVLTGYNIMGFDFEFMHDRAEECSATDAFARGLSRLARASAPYDPELEGPSWLRTSRLSSSALGDNVLKYDHKLDSYKLDHVAEHFTGQRKDDVSPSDIFRLQKGTAADRAVIAKYCVQDCALCNFLVMKLEILANNVGMANVCSVPLSFIFMRGQGVKIFSLVARQCRKDGFVVPVVRSGGDAEEEGRGYEGAVVLEPATGMYLEDPISVLDYASLYPASMISENLSHDTIVLDDAKYGSIPGVEYLTIEYRDGNLTRTCKFAQSQRGVLPRILGDLLKARKETRKRMTMQRLTLTDGRVLEGHLSQCQSSPTPTYKITLAGGESVDVAASDVLSREDAYDEFAKGVLEGLQLAFKVTANSLYGQMGARTSPLYLRDIAACTTATGRAMIHKAKAFLEKEYGAEVVYGDTDSVFVKFPGLHIPRDAGPEKAREVIEACMERSREASRAFKSRIKAPHDLEYDKVFWPFVLFSKKRYTAHMYEDSPDTFKVNSMGTVMKRRDNAPIVKTVLGGCTDAIFAERGLEGSLQHLDRELRRLAKGKVALEELVVTKTLRSHYKMPHTIPHYVLAQRIGQRDPGNKPQCSDRVPFVFIVRPGATLQGDRIETPAFIRANPKTAKIDVRHYVTNQIMKPVVQLYTIVLEDLPGYRCKHVSVQTPSAFRDYWNRMLSAMILECSGDLEKAKEKVEAMREKEVEKLLFERVLREVDNCNNHSSTITSFFGRKGA